MKVKDLIKILRNMDQEGEVLILEVKKDGRRDPNPEYRYESYSGPEKVKGGFSRIISL